MAALRLGFILKSCLLTWFQEILFMYISLTSQIPGSKNKQQKGKKLFKKPEYINEDELESDSDIAR